MSKFKAGDEVRAIRDTHSDDERHTASTQFVVGENRYGILKDGEFSAGPVEAPNRYIFPEVDFELVLDPAKEVAAPSATEATRLDPGAVKAGDTVTLHVVTIDSPAYDVSGEAYMLGHALAVGGHVLTGPGVALTAHQPAPEPEPERDRLSDVIFEAIRDQPYSFADGADQAAASVRSTFAVIDTTQVDLDAYKVYAAVLPSVEHDLGPGSAYRVEIAVRKVLEHLGLGR